MEKLSEPNGRRILVIEDSAMVVMAIEDTLEYMGWTMIGPATRVAQALAHVDEGGFDGVLLDINLDGEMSWDVADRLRAGRIPFIFTTGYSATVLPERLRGAPILNKPFQQEDLERQLHATMVRPDQKDRAE